MVSITRGVERVKVELAQLLCPSLIARLCAQVGHAWRDGPLNPVLTVQLFAMQVLHGNTAINHLRHLSGLAVTASGYCQARMRLPLTFFERLTAAAGGTLIAGPDPARRWRGHRVWHTDGSSFSMPDEPELQACFGQPGGQRAGCGFPVATLLVLTDAATGFIARTLALPLRTHEIAHASALREGLEAGDVIVADRGFCSYAQLAGILRQNLHAVFRMHQRMIVSFKPGRPHARRRSKAQRAGLPASKWLRRLGPCDQLVTWFKPDTRPRWMTVAEFAQLPGAITLRELRYRVARPGFRSTTITLVTTLTDPRKYPKQELAERYRQRWDIEQRLRELKVTMGMDVLRCRTVEGVLKELAVFVLVYNLVRLVCLRAAEQQGVAPTRVSFIDALRWLRDAPDADVIPPLIVNPPRPGRMEPRVRKRRPKQYPLMQKPRDELRQQLLQQSLAA